MDIIHKISLYGVLAFIFVGAVISLAGPELIAEAQSEAPSKTTEQSLTAAGVPHTAHGPGT